MAHPNAQIIRDLYAAFAAGDGGTVLGMFDPNIAWLEAEHIPYADGNPYLGPQAVATGVFGRIMTEWDDFRVNPHRFVTEGDVVVVMGRYTGVYKATGLPLDAQFVHAWTLREGKITAFQQYADTAQFLAVAGRPLAPVTVS